jgi:hypothetical protein
MASDERTPLLPPQTPGVQRLDEARGLIGIGGVEPSVDCGKLPSQQRSICYALQGITY